MKLNFFSFWSFHFTLAGDYIGKGGKQLRSTYRLLDRPGQKTDFWGFLPLEAYGSFDRIHQQLLLKGISSPLCQWKQRGQFQIEIQILLICLLKLSISFVDCRGSLQ